MKVVLMAHTFLSDEFVKSMTDEKIDLLSDKKVVDAEVIALTAIRTCYSHLEPSGILEAEGEKYFSEPATDGEGGRESDRLFRHITKSGHTSTLEHINYTFLIEGVSRSLLAQITRHRHLSFSVQSQRYVRMGSADKIGGFDYVTPRSLDGKEAVNERHCGRPFTPADEIYAEAMAESQCAYDRLREAGVPAEDARMVLPNAAACNLVMTGNLRTMLDFYNKRKNGKGAQWEIAELATILKDKIVKVDSWTDAYFGG